MEHVETRWRPESEDAEEDVGAAPWPSAVGALEGGAARADAIARIARIRELMEGTATHPVLSPGSALVAAAIALVACGVTAGLLAASPGARVLAMSPAPGSSVAGLAAVWGAAFVVAAASELLLTKRAAGGRSLGFYFGERSPLVRRVRLAYTAPLFAGATLTAGLVRAGALEVVPAAWLLAYGAALICAGQFSTAPVRKLGAAFLALGAAATAFPAANLAFVAAGFGGAHGVYGLVARRHEEEEARL